MKVDYARSRWPLTAADDARSYSDMAADNETKKRSFDRVVNDARQSPLTRPQALVDQDAISAADDATVLDQQGL